MVIGIQTTNRLPLPGKGDSTSAPGRSPSDSTQGTASEQEPVEIQPSAPAASQSAIVQLNFSGASAFSKARLAGDWTTSDPNASQSTPAPYVQSGDPSAAEAGGLRSSSWIPQVLAGEAGLLGMNQSLSAAVIDTSFIRATADLAASLLTGAGLRPGRVVPLAGGSETTESDESDPTDGFDSKLRLMVDLLTELSEGLTETGKAQLKRLGQFAREFGKTVQGAKADGERLQAAVQNAQARANPAARRVGRDDTRLAGRGVTFEIEISRSVQVEATVARLSENGFQAVQVQASAQSVTRLRVTIGGVAPQQRADPVVLDLDRDGEISLAALADGKGQDFDINGDGAVDRTSFVAGGDAFLALDRNGNGLIDDGGELFGDQRGAASGMEELAKLDANRDGSITRQDPLFGQLRAFYDINRDGQIGADEHRPLTELNIAALSLNYRSLKVERADGNALSAESRLEFTDGSSARMVDADLTFE